MSENRPAELNTYLEAAAAKNDALIIEALAKLEDPTRRGKLKITVASVCHLTGLSMNTVRNRPWALERLKGIKLKRQAEQQGSHPVGVEGVDDCAILDRLRKRVKQLLEQNALLYEEILSLHRIIEDKNLAIEILNSRRLAPVTPLLRPINFSKPD